MKQKRGGKKMTIKQLIINLMILYYPPKQAIIQHTNLFRYSLNRNYNFSLFLYEAMRVLEISANAFSISVH